MDLEKRYKELLDLVHTYLPSRSEALISMYEKFQDRLLLAPASSFEFFHNAFPGGYIDHTLRVVDFAFKLNKCFGEMGLDSSDYTEENIVFVALHHDLGKLGFPGEGNEMFVPNNNAWQRQNRGKIYEHNDKIPFAIVPDLSLYLLQHFKIPMNWVEYLSIKIHDGMYEEANKSYFISRFDRPKLQSNLPYLIHHADLLACRKEIATPTSKQPEKNGEVNMSYGKRGAAMKLGKLVGGEVDESINEEFKKLFS